MDGHTLDTGSYGHGEQAELRFELGTFDSPSKLDVLL